MMKYEKELVIDPAFWGRGEGPSSRLLRGDGQMCCLGFACIQEGFAAEQILNKRLPSNLSSGGRLLLHTFLQSLRENEEVIAEINDDALIPSTPEGDMYRIARLQPYFDKLGIKLVLRGT